MLSMRLSSKGRTREFWRALASRVWLSRIEHQTGIQVSSDFMIRYGEVLLRRQELKLTSGDVIARVLVRPSRRSCVVCYGEVQGLSYSSLPEYKLPFSAHFNAYLTVSSSPVQR